MIKQTLSSNRSAQPKIVLIGTGGQLGYQLHKKLASEGILYSFNRKSLDLCDLSLIRETVRRIDPDLIINAAAYTSVEDAEFNRSLAFQVNADAPGVLAEEAHRCRAGLIHFSTDYVFDGNMNRPYLEDDPPSPVNVYGRSKMVGEHNIMATSCNYVVLRTAWVYSYTGNNFLIKILKAATSKANSVEVVEDQVGTPSGVQFLTDKTLCIMSKVYRDRAEFEMPRCVFHLTPNGSTSRYHFAERILKRAVEEQVTLSISLEDLRKIETSNSPNDVERPLYTVMDTDRVQRYLDQKFDYWHEEVDTTVRKLAGKFGRF